MSKTSLKSTQERKEPVLAWSLWLGPGTEKILKQRSQKLLLQRLVEKQIKYPKRIRSTLLSRLTSFTSSPWLDGTPGLGKRNPRKSLMFWLPVLHPPSTQKFESTWTSSSSGGRSGDPEETFLLKPCCGSTKPPRTICLEQLSVMHGYGTSTGFFFSGSYRIFSLKGKLRSSFHCRT